MNGPAASILVLELFGLYVLIPILILTEVLPLSTRWLLWGVTGLYLVWLLMRLRPSWQDFGIVTWRRMRRPIILIVVISILLSAAGVWGIAQGKRLSTISPFVVATFYIFVSVPLQEVFFRGFFFYRYEKLLGSVGTAMASTILFGFYHCIFGVTLGILFALGAGLLLSLVFLRTRNIAMAWLVHSVLGALAYAAGLAHYFTTFGGPS